MLKEISFDQLLELPSKELIDFKTILNLAIAEKQEKDKLETRKELEKLALQSGFSLEELVSTKPKKKSAPALYRNPDNKSQTWSGRRRKPNWLLSALESGKNLDDLKA
jgi:DNA-binding protein H-NS